MIMRPGICGIVSFDGSIIDAERFQRMQEKLTGNSVNKITIGEWYALAQAGYESSGYEDNCLLKLDDSIICFEGRIDNRIALAQELGINVDVATYSEVISAAFKEWGPHFYQKIHGAFTVCIVVAHENKVFLANDHMGLRPMYLSEVGKSQLAFASDVSQLLAQNNAVPQLKRGKVLEMFSPLYVDDEGWSDPESTLLEGYTLLPHGTSLEIDRDGRQISTQYWHPPTPLRRDLKDVRAYAEEFRGIYLCVMKDFLDSKYSIGADLSGGIDSGCNVAVAADMIKKGEIDPRDFHTFTAIFGDGSPTEKIKIDSVLKRWPFIQQHYIQGDDLCNYLESGQYKDLRATANCSRMNIPESYVAICQLAARLGCRSVLTGEAADWYLEGTDAIWDSLIKSGNVREFIRSANVLRSRSRTTKTFVKYLYMYALRPLLPGKLGREQYLREYYAGTIDADVPDLFTESFTKELQELMKEQVAMLRKKKRLSTWNQQLEHDLMFPPNHGWQGIAVDTELKLPYLDKRLLEFGLTVPPEFKFRLDHDRVSHYGSRKCLQRYGLEDIVPHEIIQSQHKETYSTPVDNRLAESLPVVFADPRKALVTEMDITDPKKLSEAIRYALSYECADPADPVTAWLDTLLSLELWLRATKQDFGLS